MLNTSFCSCGGVEIILPMIYEYYLWMYTYSLSFSLPPPTPLSVCLSIPSFGNEMKMWERELNSKFFVPKSKLGENIFFNLFFYFNSSVVNIQHSISFRCTMQWSSRSIYQSVLIRTRVLLILISYFIHLPTHLPSGNHLFCIVNCLFFSLSLFLSLCFVS